MMAFSHLLVFWGLSSQIAKKYGLKVNYFLDKRLDLELSTCAVLYLFFLKISLFLYCYFEWANGISPYRDQLKMSVLRFAAE